LIIFLASHFLGNFAADTYSIETDTKKLQVANYRWSERYDRLSKGLQILRIRRQVLKEESDMKRETNRKGFTLVELMIVIAIVATLVALSIPSYRQYIRKSNRGEAQQLLMNWANNQEIWRASHTEYADKDELPVPGSDKYGFEVPIHTATAYTLMATATGDQAKDKERGESCTVLTLDQSNTKGPQYDVSGTPTTFCW
jgi:type IV pilus assembly protein PilE